MLTIHLTGLECILVGAVAAIVLMLAIVGFAAMLEGQGKS